jgi:hypothetical protein
MEHDKRLLFCYDIGASIITTEYNFFCGTEYTRYIWGYNSCGFSLPATLTKTNSNNPPTVPVDAIHGSTDHEIVWKWQPVFEANGYKWSLTDNFNSATNLGTDTSYTEAGLNCFMLYECYIWAYNGCAVSLASEYDQMTSIDVHPNPVSGTHVPSPTQIVWNWNTVSGATGYKWSTSNDYATAIDMETATSKTETGLTCNTTYTRYIWANNNCANSVSAALSKTTSTNPASVPATATAIASGNLVIWNWNTAKDGMKICSRIKDAGTLNSFIPHTSVEFAYLFSFIKSF